MYFLRNRGGIARGVALYVFAGSRGGPMRARIARALLRLPSNANQLAERLGVHYTTVQHHLGVMEKHGLVVGQGPHYGRVYQISASLEAEAASWIPLWDRAERAVEGRT